MFMERFNNVNQNKRNFYSKLFTQQFLKHIYDFKMCCYKKLTKIYRIKIIVFHYDLIFLHNNNNSTHLFKLAVAFGGRDYIPVDWLIGDFDKAHGMYAIDLHIVHIANGMNVARCAATRCYRSRLWIARWDTIH